MNVTDYTYLINKPDVITEKQAEALGNVLNEFPYFQSARALRLKGLYNQNSFKYNYALKVTAAHTADRSVLFDFITSENFTSIQNDFYDNKLRDLLNITVLDSELVSPEEIKKSFETRIDPIEQSILTSIKQATSNLVEEPAERDEKMAEAVLIPIEENETISQTTETEEISQDLIIEEVVAIPVKETQPVLEEAVVIQIEETQPVLEEVIETEAISEEISIEKVVVVPAEETIVIPVKESRPTFFEEVVVEDEIFDPVIEKLVITSNEETLVEETVPTVEEKFKEVRIDPIEESIYNSLKEATTVVFESKPVEEQQAVVEPNFIEEYPKEVATLVFDEVKPLETASNEIEPVVLETIPTEETPNEVITFILEEPVFIEAEPENPIVSEKAEVTEAEPIDFTTVFAEEPKAIQQPQETPSEQTVKLAEENLEIGKPLDFSVNEKHSFQEWLQLARPEPIDRSNEIVQENVKAKEEKIVKEVVKTAEIILPKIEKVEKVEVVQDEKKKKAQIIDQFIAANPKIPPIKPTPITLPTTQFDINQDDNSYLMTETLARVYLEQKKYTKAIQAYEILILKYPEKISFFADRISDIKILQQNNNNN